MTNAEKLAEALRDLLAHVEDHKVAKTRGGGVGVFKYEGTPYARVVKAREALAEYDELPKVFTVFIRDLSGTGTTFITRADADEVEAAKEIAIVECLDAWGQPDTPTSRDALHILGVAPVDINFIEWNDLEA